MDQHVNSHHDVRREEHAHAERLPISSAAIRTIVPANAGQPLPVRSRRRAFGLAGSDGPRISAVGAVAGLGHLLFS